VLLYWLARTAHYVRLSPESSALGAICYSAVLVPAVCLLRFFGRISAFTGFLAMAMAALVFGAFLLRRLAPDYRVGEGSILLTELWRESWTFGKWELAISLVTWLPANLCYSVTAVALGSSYAGDLRALQNIALPLGHTFSACLRLAIPYVCRLYEREGVQALNRAVQGLTAGAVIASVTYLGIVVLLGTLPMHWLYNGKFLEAAPMIPAILLTPLLWGALEALGVGLRAMRYPHGIFTCNLMAAVTYILVGYPLGKVFGFSGIVAGLVTTNAVALAVAIPIYRRRLGMQLQLSVGSDGAHASGTLAPRASLGA
jgi:O-antigen/teichoic acid export membrane protein